jgi:pimeloyl-ACP methyl ester carboxylesterase
MSLIGNNMQQIVSRDGTAIGVWKSGAGPPLLLVHGAMADHRRWAPILAHFEPHLTVYAMDRRGRGGSGDAPDYHLMREAEDVAAVVDAIGEPAFVLGHSYGAVCSLEGALLTHNVRRMVLYEPPIPTGLPAYPPGFPDRLQALVDRGEPEAALKTFLREVVRMPEHELEMYQQLPMWKNRIALAPTIPREIVFDQSYVFDGERFSRLEVPTMLLVGGDSTLFHRQAAELVDATLPDSRTVILPGQQHIAMDTAPELFAEEVLGFYGVTV